MPSLNMNVATRFVPSFATCQLLLIPVVALHNAEEWVTEPHFGSITPTLRGHVVSFPFQSVATKIRDDAQDAAYALANQCLDRMAPGAVYGGRSTIHLWEPWLRPFHRDPRFQAFATRLGLMEYWQQYGPPDDCDLKDGKLTCR
jgi:hypothetical protein